MGLALQVDEYVIADVDGAFVVGRVTKWGRNDLTPGLVVNELMRRYRVQVSKGNARILRHTDLYKLRSSSVDQGHSLQRPGDPPGEDTQVTQDQQVKLNLIKGQLRQMAQMEIAEYKRALHRLFLRWHPDKNQHDPENLPFYNLVLRMFLGFDWEKLWCDFVDVKNRQHQAAPKRINRSYHPITPWVNARVTAAVPDLDGREAV